MSIKQSILAILAISVLTVTSPFASAEVKIAVVDVQNAILQSEEAKRLLTQIQEEFKGEEDEIRKIQSEAAALLERMNKDADVMSDSEKRRLQQQIESMNNDFVYLRQKLQRQIEERQTELFTGIDSKVQKAIEELEYIVNNKKTSVENATIVKDELRRLHQEMTSRLAYIESLIDDM